MAICAVIGCGHRTGRDEAKVKFFRFPYVTKNCPPDRQALILNRRSLWILRIRRENFTDERASKDHSRVCSNHFISGAPAFLEDISNPDWAPSINLGHDLFDDQGNLRKRKDKDDENCLCYCDEYEDAHEKAIHKKPIRNYHQKIKKRKISKKKSSKKAYVEIDEKTESSCITILHSFPSSSSRPEAFHLKTKSGNSVTFKSAESKSDDAHGMMHLGTIEITGAAPTAVSSPNIHRTTELKNIPSTTAIPADVNFKTIKSENSHSTAPASTTFSTAITSDEDSLPSVKSEDYFSDSNHLEEEMENSFDENHEEISETNLSNSELKTSNASEQIENVTHDEAFCAAETLLQYIINQDDVNNDDINFILKIAQKIKDRISVKTETASGNS